MAMETRWPVQELEAAVVHPQRQLPVLLRVHDGQGAARHHPAGEHLGARSDGPPQAVLSGAVRERHRLHQGLQDRQRGQGGGREAHSLPDVGSDGGGTRRVDQVCSPEHQPQPVLRHVGGTEEKSAEKQLESSPQELEPAVAGSPVAECLSSSPVHIPAQTCRVLGSKRTAKA